MPGIGRSEVTVNPALAGLRSVAIGGYPDIRLYYLERDDELAVIRLLHTARDIEVLLDGEETD